MIGPFGGCLRIMLLHESYHYVVQRFRQLKKINLEFIRQNIKKITKSKRLNTTRFNIISLNTKFKLKTKYFNKQNETNNNKQLKLLFNLHHFLGAFFFLPRSHTNSATPSADGEQWSVLAQHFLIIHTTLIFNNIGGLI